MAPMFVAAGYLNIDLVAQVPVLPAADQRVTATQIRRLLGGMATNVACAAAQLGAPWPLRVELIAPAGDDEDSAWALDQVRRCGVSCTSVFPSATGSVTHCLILVEPNGQRVIVSEPLAFDDGRILQRMRDASPAENMRLLYVDGYRIPAALEAVAGARSLGWHTAVDLDGVPAEWRRAGGLAELRSRFDFVFCNRAVAAAIWPEVAEGQDRRLSTLAELSAGLSGWGDTELSAWGTLVFTLGRQGALVVPASAPAFHIPGLPVKTVDSTGAGDVFAATLLATWLHGVDLEFAARYATMAAALSTTAVGAHGHLPTAREILATPPPEAVIVGNR